MVVVFQSGMDWDGRRLIQGPANHATFSFILVHLTTIYGTLARVPPKMLGTRECGSIERMLAMLLRLKDLRQGAIEG
jgi:hypothetical protein